MAAIWKATPFLMCSKMKASRNAGLLSSLEIKPTLDSKFMVCHNCQIEAKKFGKDRKGNQRFRCASCRKTFQEPREKPLNNMYLPLDKAELCLRLLVEGNSIRSTERITGVNRNTILDLLILAG